MKRIALFLALSALMVLVVSCGKKNNNSNSGVTSSELRPVDETPNYKFTHEDTVEIRSLMSQFISRLENKDVRGAVEMLSFLQGDAVEPLSPLFQRRQTMSLVNVMGVGYKMRHMILRSYTNNEVKMDITLFEKKDGDPRPNTTAMYFRPVKYEGKWYLTVWDNITETKSEDRLEK